MGLHALPTLKESWEGPSTKQGGMAQKGTGKASLASP